MVSDEQLMLELREGTRDAFQTLFERHRDAVWRFFRRRISDVSRCEELVQDVFVALFQNSSRYQPRASVRSYLFGIAYHTMQAERRKAAHRATEPLSDTPDATADPAASLWVRNALASLEPDVRDVLMLREYEQLSYQEIADLLHVPLTTIRSRLFRARLDLKAALEGKNERRNVGRNFSSAPDPGRDLGRNLSSATEIISNP